MREIFTLHLDSNTTECCCNLSDSVSESVSLRIVFSKFSTSLFYFKKIHKKMLSPGFYLQDHFCLIVFCWGLWKFVGPCSQVTLVYPSLWSLFLPLLTGVPLLWGSANPLVSSSISSQMLILDILHPMFITVYSITNQVEIFLKINRTLKLWKLNRRLQFLWCLLFRFFILHPILSDLAILCKFGL